jgi:hypothetical protein
VTFIYEKDSERLLRHVTGTDGSGVAVAVDFLGRFVYMANAGFFKEGLPGSVSGFSIGKDETLTPVPGSPFPAGIESFSIAIAP